MYPVIKSKISVPPQAAQSILRQRLSVNWDASGASVVSICAPAGSGKTTLARQMAAVWSGKIAWYSIDATENSVGEFARYLISAIAKVIPGIRSLAPAIAADDAVSLEPILIRLLARLAKAPALMVVLDDVHLVTNPAIVAGMRFFLIHLPVRSKVILTSRTVPDLGFASLRIQRKLFEINASELSFNSEETHQFLRARLSFVPTLSESQIATALTEGWAAGLQILALVAERRGVLVSGGDTGQISREHIWEFFADEVFNRQPSAVREFLLATAVLDRFDATLAAEVAGQPDALELLDHIKKANLFLIALDDGRLWYRFHHLFAEFLQYRLATMPPEKTKAMRGRASDAWLRRGRLDEAARLALLAEDVPQLCRLMEKHGWSLKVCARHLTDACMNFLPRRTVAQSVALTMLQGWLYFDSRRSSFNNGRLKAIAPLLRDAEDALRPMLDDAEWRKAEAIFACLRAQVAEVNEDFTTAWLHLRVASERLAENDRSYIFLAMISGSLALREGHLTKAADHYRRAIQVAPQIPHLPALVWSYGRLGYILLLRGSLREAQTVWLAGVAVAKEAGLLGERNMLFIYDGLAEVMRQFNDLDAATVYLQRAHELAEQFGQSWQLPVMITRARCALTQALPSSLSSYIDAIEQLLARGDAHSHERMLADETRVGWWVASANTSALRQWLATQDLCQITSDPLSQIAARVRVRALLATGDADNAWSLMMQASNIARSQGYLFDLTQNLILLSRCYDMLGKPQQAIAALSESFVLGAQSEALGSFLALRPELEALLDGAWANNLCEDEPFARRVAELIRHRSRRRRESGERLPALVRAIPLTVSEWKILQKLAEGLSNDEIATTIFVERSTVKTHIKNAYRKLGVENRTQAIHQTQALLERLKSSREP
jgi:LuxR family transcriptional regulator, maltose regulon positive regulatory protein